MATEIINEAGETMVTGLSDAGAVRWWLEQGRKGDYLSDTLEPVADVVRECFPDAHWRIDRLGAVQDGTTGEDDMTCEKCAAKATVYVMGPYAGDWGGRYCDAHGSAVAAGYGGGAITEAITNKEEQ